MAVNNREDLHINNQQVPYQLNYTCQLRQLATYKYQAGSYLDNLFYTGFGLQLYLNKVDYSYFQFGLHFDQSYFNKGGFTDNYLNDHWTDFEIYEDTVYRLTVSYNDSSTGAYKTSVLLNVGQVWNDEQTEDDFFTMSRYYNGYTASSYQSVTTSSGWGSTTQAQQGVNVEMTLYNMPYQMKKDLTTNWLLRTDEYNSLQETYAGLSAFDMVEKAGDGLVGVLGTEVLPNITIGTLVFAPLVVIVIVAIFRVLTHH